MEFHLSVLASLPEYSAARERSIRDTCPSEGEYAATPGRSSVGSSLAR